MYQILFLGDVVARPGRTALKEHLPTLRQTLNLNAVVVNGENAAGGFGLNYTVAQELYDAGVDVITLGDHTFDQRDAEQIVTDERRILRPANFPHGTAGRGFGVYEIGGLRLGVINIIGRVFMSGSYDCPFQWSRAHMALYKLGEHYDVLIVDAHTEATSEISCLGHIWDGHASLVVGTHTHIPTADTRIMPLGTAYQSDAGMCGVYESSIGMNFVGPVRRFERCGKFPMEPAGGEATLCGVLVTVGANGLAIHARPLRYGGILLQTEQA